MVMDMVETVEYIATLWSLSLVSVAAVVARTRTAAAAPPHCTFVSPDRIVDASLVTVSVDAAPRTRMLQNVLPDARIVDAPLMARRRLVDVVPT
jgi:hypothetical protein